VEDSVAVRRTILDANWPPLSSIWYSSRFTMIRQVSLITAI